MSGEKSVSALENDAARALDSFKIGFASGRVAHAYLLAGNPKGSAGRLAEEMLSVLCCESAENRPCGECSGCGRVARRVHPDFIWLEPQKKSRTIQREQIAAVHNHVFHTSYEGGWKGVVLVNAERMNDVAANALLKMLEEPPPATLFLLLSDAPESLLATVASRCQRVIVRGNGAGEKASSVAGPAAGTDAGRESLLRAAVVAAMTSAMPGGGILAGTARAAMLLDALKAVRKEIEAEEKESLEDEQVNGGGAKDLLAARIEARYGFARHSALRFLLDWHRDLLLRVCGIDESVFHFKDQLSALRRMGGGLSMVLALDNIRLIENMKEQVDRHIPEASVFERGMTGLRHGGQD